MSTEQRLAHGPVTTVPTIALEGDANDAPSPDPRADEAKFSDKCSHRTIDGRIGCNLPSETPQASAEAIVDVDGAT